MPHYIDRSFATTSNHIPEMINLSIFHISDWKFNNCNFYIHFFFHVLVQDHHISPMLNIRRAEVRHWTTMVQRLYLPSINHTLMVPQPIGVVCPLSAPLQQVQGTIQTVLSMDMIGLDHSVAGRVDLQEGRLVVVAILWYLIAVMDRWMQYIHHRRQLMMFRHLIFGLWHTQAQTVVLVSSCFKL